MYGITTHLIFLLIYKRADLRGEQTFLPKSFPDSPAADFHPSFC